MFTYTIYILITERRYAGLLRLFHLNSLIQRDYGHSTKFDKDDLPKARLRNSATQGLGIWRVVRIKCFSLALKPDMKQMLNVKTKLKNK